MVACGWYKFRSTDLPWVEEATKVQEQDLGSHSKDLYVQIMEDHEHPELEWDPLDDTKIWPEHQFPLRHVGVMTLNRSVEDVHNENEQIAMGAGVLVDGLDFSDDKMLAGRTFSYSDTQRYRVGPNYLQLPVNQPQGVDGRVHTNQCGGQMSHHNDVPQGGNPHINHEPSIHGRRRRRNNRIFHPSCTAVWPVRTWTAPTTICMPVVATTP